MATVGWFARSIGTTGESACAELQKPLNDRNAPVRSAERLVDVLPANGVQDQAQPPAQRCER